MSDANTDTKYRMLIILLTVGLLSALYFRTFIWLVDSWLGDPAYSHGFLVPLISGFIIWKKRHELHIAPFGAGIFVFASGLFIYVAGFFWRAPFGLAISFLMVISGLILYLGGKEAMRSLLFPVCFLFFAIPLPFFAEHSQCSTIFFGSLLRVGHWNAGYSRYYNWSRNTPGKMFLCDWSTLQRYAHAYFTISIGSYLCLFHPVPFI